MPTPHQRRLIRTLRRLHAAREPLNITAVKRRHPELLKAVMAVTPYWGWKRALEAAGLAYSRIKVELLDGLECELCGKWCRNLANHLIKKHQVQPEEYLLDYSDSELICEELRAEKIKKDAAAIPHWEPLWSREYALDRLLEYHRRGIPIHSSGLTANDISLMMAVTRYAGGWREALTTIGLDPEEITRQAYLQLRHYPDKKSVIEEIRRLKQKGIPLFRVAQDSGLVLSGADYFGSWPDALRAAGIDPDAMQQNRHAQRRKYKTGKDVLEAIRRRAKRKRPILHGAVYHGPYHDATLAERARDFFGSWKAAVRSAGFDPEKLTKESYRMHRRYPDKAAVLAAIQQRRRIGRPLNHKSMANGKYRDPTLLFEAKRYFGSWPNTLRSVGIDVDALQQNRYAQMRKYKSGEDVLVAIRKRTEAGLRINTIAIKNGRHADVALINWGKKYFGSWKAALRAAGFDTMILTRELFRMHRRYPDKAAVITAIRQRRRASRPVNHTGVAKGKFSDPILPLRAKSYFGSWDAALLAAGFDPNEVRAEALRRLR